MSNFHGSLVAIVSPMDDEGQIDYLAFRRLLRAQLRAGTSGVVVAGTTGEGVSLRSRELKLLIEAALEELGGKIPVIAGVGGPATRRTIKLADLAMRCGADALLVVTPSYLKTTQQGLLAHFRAVAEQTDGPIILYNVPSRTALDMLPATVAQLAEIEQIVAIKEAAPGGGRIKQLRELCGPTFGILSGDDASWLEAMANGADGVVSVSANIAPAGMHAQFVALRNGDGAAAEAMDERLQALHAWTMSEPNPIPVKAALAELGWIRPQLRLPLVPATLETLRGWHDLKQSLQDILLEEGE